SPPSPPRPPAPPAAAAARSGTRPRATDAITVLGLGQMGLVCASILASTAPGSDVVLWGHSSEEAGTLAQSRRSPRLPELKLPDRVRVSIKDGDAVGRASLIVCAVPVQYIREVFQRLRLAIPPKAAIVSVAKG